MPRQTVDNYIRQLIHDSQMVLPSFKKDPFYELVDDRKTAIVVKIWRSKNIEAKCIYLRLTTDESNRIRQMNGNVLTYLDLM